MPRKCRAAVKQLEKRASAQCPGLLCELVKIIIFVAFVICLNEKAFKLFCVPCYLHKACHNKRMNLEGAL